MDQNSLVPCVAQSSYLSSDTSAQPGGPSPSPLPKGSRRGLVWGVGGTLLSAVGFIALALFEQYNGMISELRSDLKHFNETSSEYVKKEGLQRFREHLRECVKEMQASNAARERIEQELKASEKTRDQLASELQQLRERLAYFEGRHTAAPTVSPSAAGKN